MTVASIYDLPEVYAELLKVSHDEYVQIVALLADHDVRYDKVLDPACGPGGWLEPFAAAGCSVAGNDIRENMVEAARRRLPDAEFTVGDMTRLLMPTAPFDLALNLSSSIGHLEDDAAVSRHLGAVHAHLVPGGAYVVEVSSPTQPRTRPRSIWSSRKVPVEGGHAKVSYRSVMACPADRVERISLELRTWSLPNAPRRLVECYDLRTFSEDDLAGLATGSGFTVDRMIRTAGDDLLAVLRR